MLTLYFKAIEACMGALYFQTQGGWAIKAWPTGEIFMKFLILSFLLSSAAYAGSGGMDGGGGQGILCELPNGQRTIRSMDLYEAEHIWGYNIPRGLQGLDEWSRIYPNASEFRFSGAKTIGKGRAEIPPPKDIEEDFDAYIGAFNKRLRSIPAGSHLNLSGDQGSSILQPPSNCKIVQVLFYADEDIDSGQILVDREYWDLLSSQDQQSFYFHEDIYKRLRSFGAATNSKDVRKVVGLIFRTGEFPAISRATYEFDHLTYCYVTKSDVDISFFRVPATDPNRANGDPYAKLVFTALGDTPLLVETYLDSIWNLKHWEAGKFTTSPQVDWTKSVLGSVNIRLGFSDNSCIENKFKCIVEVKIRSKEGKWQGGPIECRQWR